MFLFYFFLWLLCHTNITIQLNPPSKHIPSSSGTLWLRRPSSQVTQATPTEILGRTWPDSLLVGPVQLSTIGDLPIQLTQASQNWVCNILRNVWASQCLWVAPPRPEYWIQSVNGPQQCLLTYRMSNSPYAIYALSHRRHLLLLHQSQKAIFQMCLSQLHKLCFFIPIYFGPNPWIDYTFLYLSLVSYNFHPRRIRPTPFPWSSSTCMIKLLISSTDTSTPTLNMTKPFQTSLLIYHLLMLFLNALEYNHV